jgi:hypothetical protein
MARVSFVPWTARDVYEPNAWVSWGTDADGRPEYYMCRGGCLQGIPPIAARTQWAGPRAQVPPKPPPLPAAYQQRTIFQWNPVRPFEKGALVMWNGQIYRATQLNKRQEPEELSHYWDSVRRAGYARRDVGFCRPCQRSRLRPSTRPSAWLRQNAR